MESFLRKYHWSGGLRMISNKERGGGWNRLPCQRNRQLQRSWLWHLSAPERQPVCLHCRKQGEWAMRKAWEVSLTTKALFCKAQPLWSSQLMRKRDQSCHVSRVRLRGKDYTEDKCIQQMSPGVPFQATGCNGRDRLIKSQWWFHGINGFVEVARKRTWTNINWVFSRSHLTAL